MQVVPYRPGQVSYRRAGAVGFAAASLRNPLVQHVARTAVNYVGRQGAQAMKYYGKKILGAGKRKIQDALKGARAAKAQKTAYSGPGQSFVTRQHDITFTKRSTRRFRRSKASRKSWRKFKRKVKKATSKPSFTFVFYQNASRSWKSAASRQAVCLIPIMSWRGQSTSTGSVPLGVAAASPAEYTFRSDQSNIITNLTYQNLLFSQGTSTNLVQPWWWWKHLKTTVDVTMTNQGTSTTSDGTNRNVEYDIYLCWANKRCPKDKTNALNDMTDWEAWLNQGESVRSNYVQNADDNGIGDAAWTPYSNPLAKKRGLSSVKIASGYIDQSESVRFRKSYRIKGIVNKQNYEAEDFTGAGEYSYNNRAFGPGKAMFIVVCFRGMPDAGTSSADYAPGRLGFTCNWKHYIKVDGKNQSGFQDSRLVTDDYQ